MSRDYDDLKMVKQQTRPKNSSETEDLSYNRSDRDRLLTDLANLHDQGHEKFWAWRRGLRERFWGHVPDEKLTELRDQLRRVWNRDVLLKEKKAILTEWLQLGACGDYPFRIFRRASPAQISAQSSTARETPPFLLNFELGRIVPNPANFLTELTGAVLARYRGLAVCYNPWCAAPYFVAKRKTQKYCDRGDCTAFAQRQYALSWWRRKHDQEPSKRARKEK